MLCGVRVVVFLCEVCIFLAVILFLACVMFLFGGIVGVGLVYFVMVFRVCGVWFAEQICEGFRERVGLLGAFMGV